MLWLRALFFAALVPGVVLGWVPAWLVATGRVATADLGPARWLGVPPLGAGAALMLVCIADFMRRGRGTLAPVDPPTRLVTAGPYRWVRNPMYVAGAAILTGEALWWQAPALLAYLALFWSCAHLFVTGYEERALARRFGAEYLQYREAVPRWLPRRPERRSQQSD
jgi:protein-S-isoprenylcysteine O-methyltransferase Ste14